MAREATPVWAPPRPAAPKRERAQDLTTDARIEALLQDHGAPLTARECADSLECSIKSARHSINRMLARGRLVEIVLRPRGGNLSRACYALPRGTQ